MNAAIRHRFLEFSDRLPSTRVTSALATSILNTFAGITRSVSDYRRGGPLAFTWTDNQGQPQRSRFRFESLVDHMRKRRTLDLNAFNLPPLLSPWLDSSIGISKPDAPIVAVDGKSHLPFMCGTPLGDHFPYAPSIDREGIAISSLQLEVQKNIVRQFHDLINGPEDPLSLDGNWLWNFSTFLHNCVAIVDMTLHQLYYMAEYQASQMGWTFSRDVLGPREGRRLMDKLNWIAKITGCGLDDAKREVEDFTIIKNLRNHLTHFDPPIFAYTMEDVEGWLNKVPSIGRLLWKIRRSLKTPLTQSIIAMILLPSVVFIPRDPRALRVTQPEDMGYGSTNHPPMPRDPNTLYNVVGDQTTRE